MILQTAVTCAGGETGAARLCLSPVGRRVLSERPAPQARAPPGRAAAGGSKAPLLP